MIHKRHERTRTGTGKWVKWTLRENKCTLEKPQSQSTLDPSSLSSPHEKEMREREMDGWMEGLLLVKKVQKRKKKSKPRRGCEVSAHLHF